MTTRTRPYVRPGAFMTHVANPIVRRLGLYPTLVVPGRTSGRTLAVPMGAPIEVDGQRYIVSGRGSTQWVRNLRAAGRGEFRLHGRSEAFRPTELEGAERARIVAEYRRKLGRSVDPYFRRIPDPADHPVFRIDPIDEGD